MVSSLSALDIAQALIRCPSVTPIEGGALAYLDTLFRERGFVTQRLSFSDHNTPTVENLYARFGTGAPHLCFAGHTDVVPPGDEKAWRFPPFSATIAEDRLWGRGACDMKGGIAAFSAAIFAYLDREGPPRGSISCLITGDEEGPAINGTRKLLEWATQRGECFDHCLVGEPTNPRVLGEMIKVGRRGSLNGTIILHGRQGHSAYPERADNPIPTLARIVTALTAAPLDAGSEAFEPTRLVVTSFDVGNPARNVIPAEARALFNVRFNDLWTPETLATQIRTIAEAAAPEAAIKILCEPTNSLSFRTPPSPFIDSVAAVIERCTGHVPERSTSGGTSDARFISQYCPVVEFGLVGASIHAVNENTTLEDLERLTQIYGNIITDYFSKA